jgi:hypothetical protein
MQTRHWNPMFELFMKHNFKYNTKTLHMGPIGHETQISSKTWHELNFMPNFQFHAKFPTRALPGEARISAPYFYARTFIVFVCLPHMFTLMLTPWLSRLALAPRFLKVVCFSSLPWNYLFFFSFFIFSYMRLLLFLFCKLIAHRFGTHDRLMLGLLSLVYMLKNFVP